MPTLTDPHLSLVRPASPWTLGGWCYVGEVYV